MMVSWRSIWSETPHEGSDGSNNGRVSDDEGDDDGDSDDSRRTNGRSSSPPLGPSDDVYAMEVSDALFMVRVCPALHALIVTLSAKAQPARGAAMTVTVRMQLPEAPDPDPHREPDACVVIDVCAPHVVRDIMRLTAVLLNGIRRSTPLVPRPPMGVGTRALKCQSRPRPWNAGRLWRLQATGIRPRVGHCAPVARHGRHDTARRRPARGRSGSSRALFIRAIATTCVSSTSSPRRRQPAAMASLPPTAGDTGQRSSTVGGRAYVCASRNLTRAAATS